MRTARWIWASAFLAAVLSSAPAGADDIPSAIGVQVENDLFGSGLDRHYTNGLQIFGVVGSEYVPDLAIEWMDKLPYIDPSDKRVFVVTLGQHMYSPSDISATLPDPSDRPYAGWLYLSLGAAVEEKDKSRLHDVSLDIGVVGPASLAGPTQRRWHALINTTTPMGWGHQLKNEPGLVLTYQTRKRVQPDWKPGGLEVDLTPAVGGAVGNVFTYANVGAAVRVGHNLNLTYGAPLIRPNLPSAGLVRKRNTFGWNLFAGVEGRGVARNIFLDGNTWRSGPSVSRRPFVLDGQVGVEVIWKDVRISFTQILRTREFDGQDKPDRFGSLSLTKVF